jgi:hypothetical protein
MQDTSKTASLVSLSGIECPRPESSVAFHQPASLKHPEGLCEIREISIYLIVLVVDSKLALDSLLSVRFD